MDIAINYSSSNSINRIYSSCAAPCVWAKQTNGSGIDALLFRVSEDVTARLMASAYHKIERDGILATRLCTHKDDVELTNENKLQQLPGLISFLFFFFVLSICSFAVKTSESLPLLFVLFVWGRGGGDELCWATLTRQLLHKRKSLTPFLACQH